MYDGTCSVLLQDVLLAKLHVTCTYHGCRNRWLVFVRRCCVCEVMWMSCHSAFEFVVKSSHLHTFTWEQSVRFVGESWLHLFCLHRALFETKRHFFTPSCSSVRTVPSQVRGGSPARCVAVLCPENPENPEIRSRRPETVQEPATRWSARPAVRRRGGGGGEVLTDGDAVRLGGAVCVVGSYCWRRSFLFLSH